MDRLLEIIAFDADDTLWHNETLYASAQQRLAEILSPYHGGDGVAQALFETEMANLPLFGYGLKSFALSMVETAIRLSQGQIGGRDIQQIVDLAKEMKRTPPHLLDHVAEVIPLLSAACPLMLITKGDLLDQEEKLARSGLAAHFRHVEIVSDKTGAIYAAILDRYQIDPGRFLMVGNSLRSDILPVVALGGQAVYIPYQVTWAHEVVAQQPAQPDGYVELDHIGLLPEYVAPLCQQV
jgi:putative hydrolase of the HAD superfamily